MPERTAHVDTFARDNLPPASEWPDLDFSGVPELAYPPRLNCASELLDQVVMRGQGDRIALRTLAGVTLTYREVLARANQLAHVLVSDLGVVPGTRVMLRGPNSPMMVIAWFATLKVGAIAVSTMPMLRARELRYVIEKAKVDVALCDERLRAELDAVTAGARPQNAFWGGTGGLESAMEAKRDTFENVDTAADDVALIAFTSGTTGPAKGSMHFHRDVLAVCDLFPVHVLKATADDVFCGTPPLAFTFGLGALLLFPFRVGASALLIEKPTAEGLLAAIATHKATICFTAPTMYRALTDIAKNHDLSSLTKCVSAGETLPLPIWEGWRKATGIKIIDGLGSTEMLHIVVASAGDDIRPGATGKVIRGYEARVVDEKGEAVPAGTIGRLAVRGPTGCRYLQDPERQCGYVEGGWNMTGDAYKVDADGYFWFQARSDDMIISAGYNISGPEVEGVLLEHPQVKECAVVASPDVERGFIVKAFVVLREGVEACEATVMELQRFVKSEVAPYKYPRAIDFIDALPRTENGKIQRFKLRDAELGPNKK